MSGTTTKSRRTQKRGSDMNDLIIQVNLLMASLDGIAAKLDLDAGVTDVNYGSLWTTQYSRVGNLGGTIITTALS